MTQFKPPQNQSHFALISGLAFIVIGWIWFSSHRVSAADTEASVFEHMSKSGRSERDLCTQAKVVEDAYARENNAAQADHWTTRRKSACISADMCALLEGGCPPTTNTP